MYHQAGVNFENFT